MNSKQRGAKTLPSRPNLEHLESQAKDLLAAHRSSSSNGDVEVLARIRAAVPAYANQSDDAIRNGPFALHDAQSAVAREYGFPSWAALRSHVSALGEEAKEAVSEAPKAPDAMRSRSGSSSSASTARSRSRRRPPAESGQVVRRRF